MTDKNNMEKMARDFLDLWQKQLNSTMKEPDIAGEMMRNMQAMQQKFFEGGNVTAQPDVSEHGDDELRKLDQRIRACEQRLDALERKSKSRGGKSSKSDK